MHNREDTDLIGWILSALVMVIMGVAVVVGSSSAADSANPASHNAATHD